MILGIQKLFPTAIRPLRGSKDAVGFDLHAHLLTEQGRPNTMLIPSGTTRAVPTGIAVVPMVETDLKRWYVQICSRSGMAKESVFVANAPGIIDPDYTGEVMVLLYNGRNDSYWVKHEDRIAQMIVAEMVQVNFQEIDLAPPTERGAKGLGSTGR